MSASIFTLVAKALESAVIVWYIPSACASAFIIVILFYAFYYSNSVFFKIWVVSFITSKVLFSCS